jgi:hypothetical protein
MLVLQNQDGSPYVFPPLRQMESEIRQMTLNSKADIDGQLITSLRGLGRQGASAELTRLKYLRKVAVVRQLVQPQAVGPRTLSQASAAWSASKSAQVGYNQFLTANQYKVGSLDSEDGSLKAIGRQAYDVTEKKEESDRLDVRRAKFRDGRDKFWARELEVVIQWIDKRVSYIGSEFGVVI